ncbi:ABC transporter permease [Methylobrevis albus]|uniref:ABC transporter permease n=1 Tax=Methylobrevis albus TaxID=2793297 RepID=A0A931I1P9_9HYPH|nr:ABC transporter permease [Methylobrevis albus]
MPRRLARALGWAAVLGGFYVFVYLPVAVLVLFSFQDGRLPVPPFNGPTLAWYGKVLGNGRLLEAAWNSVVVGVGSSMVATLLGFLAAYGLARHRVPGRRLIHAALVLPLTVSYLVIGLGLLVTFNAAGLPKSLLAVAIGHLVINLPLCFLVAAAQMGPAEARLEQAARDLGASEWQVLTRVALPLALPSLFAAFCLSFTLSWDEFVIAFLLTNFDVTLPVVIWSMLRTGLNPETNAAGTLVFAVSLLLVAGAELVLARRGRAAR